MPNNKINWKKYTLEFFSIFIAVISAFALNNWNDNRRDSQSEEKILKEIKNGLLLDLKDIATNKSGHEYGINTCEKFRKLINNEAVDQSSILRDYTILVRDFTSIMNMSGYESLKSKGLEIVKNDSLRFQIISLYDFEYQIIDKLEEGATEMQSFENYFKPINDILYPFMEYDENGRFNGFSKNMKLTELEKKEILSYLWRIERNRSYKMIKYKDIEEKIELLVDNIDKELE